MNIDLKGIYSVLPKWKKKSGTSWVDKELYYDLDCYNKIDSDEPVKHFIFLNKDDAELGNYYKIKGLIKYKDNFECISDISKMGFDDKCTKDISNLFERLNSQSDNALVHYYKISEENYYL